MPTLAGFPAWTLVGAEFPAEVAWRTRQLEACGGRSGRYRSCDVRLPASLARA